MNFMLILSLLQLRLQNSSQQKGFIKLSKLDNVLQRWQLIVISIVINSQWSSGQVL